MTKNRWASAVATMLGLLSITGVDGQTIYNWTNGAGGSWSDPNWTPSTPAAGGGVDFRLTFNAAGTYTANNDLTGTFQLNQLLFEAGTPTLSGNPLQLSSVGWVSNNAAIVAAVNNDIDFVASATFGAVASRTLILNGALSGSGPVTNVGAGTIVLTGPASYSGPTVVRATGSGAWQGLVLSNTTGGVAIPGDVDLGGGGGANVYLRLGANEQIADTAVLTFNTSANHGRFILLGRTETIAGIQTTTGLGVVESTDQQDPAISEPATLILSPAAGQSFSFNGWLRNAFTSGRGLLNVVKTGEGTQILAGGNIAGSSGLNSMEVQNGTLVLRGTTQSLFTTPITISGGQLVLASDTAAARNPITNWVSGGVQFSNGVTTATLGSLSGSGDVTLQNWDGSAVTLFVGSNNLSGTYSGSLSGPGSLRKVGTGTFTLSGNNTYSGNTILDAGTLLATQPSSLPGYNVSGKITVNTAILAVPMGSGAWGDSEVSALIANASWNTGSRLNVQVATGSESISGNIAGVLRLTKLGAGELILNGNNSYTGWTILQEGTLAVSSGANLPTSGTLVITGGVLRVLGTALANLDAYTLNTTTFRGGVAVDDPSHVLTISQNLTGGGYLVKDGAGTLALTGANSLTAVTNLAGSLRVNTAGAWPEWATLHIANGSVNLGSTTARVANLTGGSGATITNQMRLVVFQNTAGEFAGALVGAGDLVKTGSATLALSGASSNFSGNAYIYQGTLLVSHSQALGNGGQVYIAPTSQNGLLLTNNIDVSGVTLSLASDGPSYFGGLQSANMSTNTWSGTVVIGDNNPASWRPRLGAGSSGVLIISGDIVDGVGSNIYISGGAGTGTVILSGTNNTYSGLTGIIRGVLKLGRDNALPTSTPLIVGVTGNTMDQRIVDLNGFNQTVGALGTVAINGLTAVTNTAGSMTTLTVNQTTNTTFAGVLGGPLALVKQGGGTLTLAGTNVHTGITQVDGGKLEISNIGSVHQSPKIIVGAAGTLQVPDGYTLPSGQRLEGNGTVQGGLIVGSGATLAPGFSPGQLTLQGNLTLQSGSTFEVELNGLNPGTQYDQLLFSGGSFSLTLNNPTLNVVLGFTPSLNDSFTIVSGFSSLSGTFSGLPNEATFTVGGTEFQINYGVNDITLTVVPEPGTLGALSLAFAVSVVLRRRMTLRGQI